MSAGIEATALRKHDPRKWAQLRFGEVKSKALDHELVGRTPQLRPLRL